MSAIVEDDRVEALIELWRSWPARSGASESAGPEASEAELRQQVAELRSGGLPADEALLVAVKRVAMTDSAMRAFAREKFAGLWDEPDEMVSEDAPESTEAPVEQAHRRSGFFAMAVFACAAAVAIRVPEFFGIGLTDSDGTVFYARNFSLLVLPALAGWFVWTRRPSAKAIGALAAVLAVSAVVMNAYPFDEGGSTDLLAIVHLPALLWLVVGVAFVGRDWRSSSRRMDYVRFTGEWCIYYVLIALAGGVFAALAAGVFWAIDVDSTAIAEWLVPAGSAGAVVVTAWLVGIWQGAVSRIVSMLAYIFTPLFAVMLVVFLAVVLLSGRQIEADRDVLILFNVLLGLVVGLLLFSAAARRRGGEPGGFDALTTLLAAAGLVTNVLVLAAIIGRIADFGWSPNRAAVLGINLILLVNLAGTVWVYAAAWRRRRPLADIERWQTAHFGVYAAWAALVIVAFPPIFDFA